MRRLNDGAPTAAGRRGGVERPRASLADPPSISGPAASAWRPMTAACRAHDRAAPPPPRPFAGAGRRQCPRQQPGVGALNGLAPLWRILRRSPGQQHQRGGQWQQPAGLMTALPLPRAGLGRRHAAPHTTRCRCHAPPNSN